MKGVGSGGSQGEGGATILGSVAAANRYVSLYLASSII